MISREKVTIWNLGMNTVLFLLAGMLVSCVAGKKNHVDEESEQTVLEEVWLEHGHRVIRIAPDETISHPEMVADKEKCFIVMSKKDYYLYVYEARETDTALVARYDCCFALRKGQKQQDGDMRTPHCTMDNPFVITEIVDASTWCHDFGDGRGSIRAYGDYFLRLDTHGHKGIGIHGSTNNVESVPGRASEGCIRLHDADIVDLTEHYAFLGMKVVIKAEEMDDLPFEVEAMKKQQVHRLRHLSADKALTNQQVDEASDVRDADEMTEGEVDTIE